MKLPLAAAAFTGMQVGAAIVASRQVVGEVPPLTLALLRYAIGVACLLPFVRGAWRRGAPRPLPARAGRDAVVIAALGIGQFAVLIALMNHGLQTVSAARAALIFSLTPLLTLLLGAALGRERLTPALIGGLLLSIGGVALELLPRLAAQAAAPVSWHGVLAVAASALVGAVCSVLYRPYLQRYPTLPVSALAMGASVLFLAVLALTEGWPQRVMALTAPTWSVIGFIGLSSGLGYFALLYALKHESPTRVMMFLALNPMTAAALGWALLGERLDGWSWAALACIVAGLWLGTRRSADAINPRAARA